MSKNIKISVITPSIRPAGLKIVQECLAEQTFTDFEWLVEVGLKKEHDLNKAFNKMIRRAQGELLVFYQDYIKIEKDGLEKMWKAHQLNYNTFITAPVGKADTYTASPSWDWRKFDTERTGDYKQCEWYQWEIDWACAPKKALFDIGGFDEELDGDKWSCDNVNVGKRAHLHGCKFMVHIDNPAVALDHDKFEVHPFRHNYSPNHNNDRMNKFETNYKLDFLK
jgi:hypothetical protein